SSNNYDLVHAHARIPAFYCSTLCKKYDVRFVTTAHFKFSTSPLWRRLTNWGEKTFSVSEDISGYLLDNYNVHRDNIVYVPNGIDFDKFKYDSELRKETRKEIGAEKRKVVLNISRLTQPASICSIKILESAKEILKENQEYLFVFIGVGDDYPYIKEESEKINKEYGKTLVLTLGEKKDVVPYLCAADIFIGPSRAALESLSVGIPTLICGTNGYIGELTKDNYDVAESTNLCCNGCYESSVGNIVNGIKTISKKSKSEILELIRNQNDFIERYSIKRMVDIYESVYLKLDGIKLKSKANALMCGYYGYDNLGDEAMLSSFMSEVRNINKDINICVMTSNQKNTYNEHLVQTINRYNIFSIIKKIKETGHLIVGGGNLFQNKTSNRSLYYYLYIIKLAKKYGAKVIIYANGFGPLKDGKDRNVIEALKGADYISVREKSSYDFCVKNGIDAVLTADPVFLNEFTSRESFNSDYFVMVPHGIKSYEINDVCANIRTLQTKLCLTPVIVSLHDKQDAYLCQSISDRLGGKCQFMSQLGFGTLQDIIKSSAFVISNRYHAVVCAVMTDQIVVAMGDSKMRSIMKELGIIDCMFDSYDKIQQAVNYAMTNNRVIRTMYNSDKRTHVELAKRDVMNVLSIISQKN
ncbi:MAG: glycosyltransferase, partial [Clostridia bacterium]|nr:glycosyltransferase [Clostridia bacterium]